MYLLYGLEKYLIDEEIKKIITSNQVESININKYNLEETSLENILDDASTISLFQNNKVIIVENSYIFAAPGGKKTPEQNIEQLIKYLEHYNPDTILIFTLNKEKIDTRKKIVSMFKQNGVIKEFNTILNINEWVSNQIKPYSISREDIQFLINRVGSNLNLLTKEIEKLKTYKSGGTTITSEDIEQLTHKNIDLDIFKLIDSILSSQKKESLECLEEMIKYGEEPIAIIIILANQFRIMYQAKSLLKKGYSEREIANILEVHEFRIKKALEKGRKYDNQKILMKLEELADLDYQIKSGQIDKNIGLELFILNM